MPDIVNIVASNSYTTNGCIISCFDSTTSFPGLTVGVHVTPVVAALINAGYDLYDYGADGSVNTYLLIRGNHTGGCNPLVAFKGRLNTPVTVSTAAGVESGLLLVIGSDAIEILEGTGDIVLIPARSIQSVI
jgi:hypothetical protein